MYIYIICNHNFQRWLESNIQSSFEEFVSHVYSKFGKDLTIGQLRELFDQWNNKQTPVLKVENTGFLPSFYDVYVVHSDTINQALDTICQNEHSKVIKL